MKEPIWVTKEVILATQGELLSRFGGLPGIRDEGLLESALARPRQLFQYESPGIYKLASAYAFGIVKNHPFNDGNKRAAFMSAYIFLGINGQELDVAEEVVVLQTVALAAGEISQDDYATWLEANCTSAES